MVAEVVELADESAGGAGLAGAFEEVVAAEVGVLGVVGEHVPDRDQERVLQGDQGAFASAAADEPAVAGGKVGVLGAAGGKGGLAQYSLEPGVSVAGAAGGALAC